VGKKLEVTDKQTVVMRGTKEFRLDQFLLKPAKRLKNKSWTANAPKFIREIHTHFYRSHNPRTGETTDLCIQTGLHWHKVKVEWDTDEKGEQYIKSATCGPALKKVEVRSGGRALPVTKLSPIRWKTMTGTSSNEDDEDIINLDAENVDWVYDDHTHEVEYMHSEFMDMNTSKQIMDKNKAQISNAMDRSAPVEKQALAAAAIKESADNAPAQES